MDEKLKKNLREIQSHPTTGLPHNQQVISAQVESIFMLDSLGEKIDKLNKTLIESGIINQKLEQSNFRLQWAMLILTAITTFTVIFPIFKAYFTSLFVVNAFGFSVTAATSGLIAALVSGLVAGALLELAKRKLNKMVFTNLSDQIIVQDSVKVAINDKSRKVKETRKID